MRERGGREREKYGGGGGCQRERIRERQGGLFVEAIFMKRKVKRIYS